MVQKMPQVFNKDRHPIQVVSRRTGLTPELLRAWERRYEAVVPTRSPGNRRFYTDEDIARLLLLRGLIEAGRSIKQIAHLPTPELERMLSDDRQAESKAGGPRRSKRSRERGDSWGDAVRGELPGPATIDGYLEPCLDAVRRLDSSEFEAILARAHLAFGRIAFIERLVVPLLQRIGDLWQDGSLRVMHEHLTSAIVRTVLGQIVGHSRVRPEAPLLIMATPAGQIHELGALVIVALAASEGWRVLYLGPDLPAEEIAAAARQRSADAVALSIVHPADDPRLHEQLAQLRELLPPGLPLLVGGAAAPAYRTTLEAIEAAVLLDLTALRQALRERGAAATS
jgi:DNA-binding transcriptional MerR regulator/methylmalonyl-CoA mutase cobalamin-binding subunit